MTTVFLAVVARNADPYHAVVTWTLTGAGVGNPIAMPGYRLRTISAVGTFNSGTLTVLGGNDDAQADTGVGVVDQSNTAISATSNKMFGIQNAPAWIYPSATAATSIVVRAYYERSIGA